VSVGGTPTLLGVPFDAASSFLRGAAAAPPLIREALRSPASNRWTELGVDLGAPGALADEGDLAIDAALRGAELHALIETHVSRLIERGGRPIVLGGDHSITPPIVRAVRRISGRLEVVHFDAHPDLYDEFDGNRWSHASPFARLMEEGLVARLVQVGIRTMNGHQRAQADRFGVEVIDMRAWSAGKRVVAPAHSAAYLSIDCDVFDPAFAPGVSHREPGGLSPRDVLDAIQRLDAQIVGADIVECNPSRDAAGVTAALCAKLVKEVAGRMTLAGREAP
jgi:arginase